MSQIDINHDAYRETHRHGLEKEHLGKYALMHDAQVVAVLDTLDEAFNTGMDDFGAGQFSIEEIGAQPIHLGAFGLASFDLADA